MNNNYIQTQHKQQNIFLLIAFGILSFSAIFAYLIIKTYSGTLLNLNKIKGLNKELENSKKYLIDKTNELELSNNNLGHNKIQLEEAINRIKYEKERAEQAYEEAKVSEEEAVSSQEEILIANEKLQYANEAKSEFLSNMSHEIRTPLNGIIGITDILLEEELSNSQKKDYLEIIKSSSTTLKNIINDILDFSKIQSGKFQINRKDFSLKSIIKDLENLFYPMISKKGLKFIVEIDDKIDDNLIGDSLRITQVLTNLISNSIKFTHNGTIKISLVERFKRGDKIELKIIISDTGIGISEKVQHKIFESFEQGEMSNTKEFQGTGLGLAISKSLVNLMGGSIWFESYIGVGTKFFITLPFQISKQTNKKVIKENIKQKVVLKYSKKAILAEDSEVNQLVAKKILENLGFEVHIAINGEEAVDLMRKSKYDIIFMDLQMPQMDGFEATKKIRFFNEDIPILALSAAVLDDDVKKCLQIGMNGHIKKPIDKNEIIETVSKYFEMYEGSLEDLKKELEDSKTTNIESINSKYFSIKDLKEKFDYSNEEILTLLSSFTKSYEHFGDSVNNHEAISEEVKFSIHKLKGASGNLMNYPLYDKCEEFELSDNSNKEVILESILNELNYAIEDIKIKIIPLVKKDKLVDEELVNFIKEIINDHKSFKHVTLMRHNELTNSLIDVCYNQELEKITKAIQALNRKEIIQYLEEILKKLN